MEIVFRQLGTTESEMVRSSSWLLHPLHTWLGLRPVPAQHTLEENRALRRWARGRKALVEIGVAEGASALALRQVMYADGVLYLIDPFHLSRFPIMNSVRRIARRTVSHSRNGRVEWVEQFSWAAARSWAHSIDFLFIDGDHSEEAVRQDWNDWSGFLGSEGVVAFHDARTFPSGWTSASDGPVMLVDQLFRNSRRSGWEIVDEVHSLVIVRRSA
jgi:hypothetical protein